MYIYSAQTSVGIILAITPDIDIAIQKIRKKIGLDTYIFLVRIATTEDIENTFFTNNDVPVVPAC